MQLKMEAIGVLIIKAVEPSRPPEGLSFKKKQAFMKEREWLLREYEKMADPDEQWSNIEYEWFVNRILNHCEQSKK